MTDSQYNATSSTDTERLVTGYTGRLSLSISGGWLAMRLGRDLLAPLLPTVIDTLAISASKAGMALTVLWACYALSQYPSGQLTDQLSRVTVVMGSLLILIIGFTTFTATTTYPVFLVGAVFVGTGMGCFFISARAWLADLFVSRRGQAFGLQLAAGSVGSAIAAGLAIVVLQSTTWRFAFIPVIFLLVGVAAAVHYSRRQPYVITSVTFPIRADYRNVLTRRDLIQLAIIYIMFSFTFQAVTSFLPTLLHVGKGFSTSLASTSFAAVFLLGIVTGPVTGKLGDRFAHPPMAGTALFIACLGLVSLLAVDTTVGVLVSTAMFALGLTAFPPVMQAHVMDALSDTNLGSELGVFRTLYIGIGSLGSTYVGLVAEHINYVVAFAGIAAGLLIGSVLIFYWLVQPS